MRSRAGQTRSRATTSSPPIGPNWATVAITSGATGCSGRPMASARTWIEQAGLEGRFANGGFDLVPGVIDAIQVGTAQWSIAQNPYAQGWITSALIHMAVEHDYPAFSYDTGAEVVDATNIEAVAEREAVFAE